ncbi:MAG: exodeoxyribonuclease VII small subunit [Saprospiraceae bacterium]
MKKNVQPSPDFDSAYAELQAILEDIQNENTPLETLETKIARAGELIAFCKERLRAAGEAVEKIMGEDK